MDTALVFADVDAAFMDVDAERGNETFVVSEGRAGGGRRRSINEIISDPHSSTLSHLVSFCRSSNDLILKR